MDMQSLLAADHVFGRGTTRPGRHGSVAGDPPVSTETARVPWALLHREVADYTRRVEVRSRSAGPREAEAKPGIPTQPPLPPAGRSPRDGHPPRHHDRSTRWWTSWSCRLIRLRL